MIPNHPELPAHLKNLQPGPPDLVQRVIRRTKRAEQRAKQREALQVPLPPQSHLVLHAHEDFYPHYPEDWVDVTEEARDDYLVPTHATNVASRTTCDLTSTEGATLQNPPAHIKQAIFAVHIVNTELHEHAHTVHGIKDLVLAQNRDVHVLALTKLVQGEEIDQDIFPEDVRIFARNYFEQKKELLFLNLNGVLCAKYPSPQRPLHERPCMIVMPQLYQMKSSFVRMMPWASKASVNSWRAYKNVTHGLAYAAQWANMSANASLVSKFGTSLETYVFTSKISKAVILTN